MEFMMFKHDLLRIIQNRMRPYIANSKQVCKGLVGGGSDLFGGNLPVFSWRD